MDIDLKEIAIKAAKKAGAQILTNYKIGIESKWKGDGSPFTIADYESHEIILRYLKKTGIPIVSEESNDLHISADRYWIVDPLDGTKEFLDNIDEFTVNIALVENRRPIFGVVYAPALEELYVGGSGYEVIIEIQGIQIAFTQKSFSNYLVMAVSRYHNHKFSPYFASKNKIMEQVQLGSSLKFMRLVLGNIDVYPRFEGCSEWDTAAAQAILMAAGGDVIDFQTGTSLEYGKASRRNSSFLAFRAPYTLKDFII